MASHAGQVSGCRATHRVTDRWSDRAADGGTLKRTFVVSKLLRAWAMQRAGGRTIQGCMIDTASRSRNNEVNQENATGIPVDHVPAGLLPVQGAGWRQRQDRTGDGGDSLRSRGPARRAMRIARSGSVQLGRPPSALSEDAMPRAGRVEAAQQGRGIAGNQTRPARARAPQLHAGTAATEMQQRRFLFVRDSARLRSSPIARLRRLLPLLLGPTRTLTLSAPGPSLPAPVVSGTCPAYPRTGAVVACRFGNWASANPQILAGSPIRGILRIVASALASETLATSRGLDQSLRRIPSTPASP